MTGPQPFGQIKIAQMADTKILQMADASGGFLLYTILGGSLTSQLVWKVAFLRPGSFRKEANMLSADLRAAKAMMHMRTAEVEQQTRSSNLLLEAGVQHQGWLSQRSCWLLCQFGCKLVELGRRLEQRHSFPQPVSVER
jgi:hypothetical protein